MKWYSLLMLVLLLVSAGCEGKKKTAPASDTYQTEQSGDAPVRGGGHAGHGGEEGSTGHVPVKDPGNELKTITGKDSGRVDFRSR